MSVNPSGENCDSMKQQIYCTERAKYLHEDKSKAWFEHYSDPSCLFQDDILMTFTTLSKS